MATPLRALVVEDSEDDTLLLLRELRRGGYDVSHQRVEVRETMQAALAGQAWDVVLADCRMPHFSAPEALQVLKESGLDLPFIIVSGTIGEETAVACMKAGAHDYLLKGNMIRLCAAVEREVREANVRLARRQAEEALRQSEERYRSLFENMLNGFAYCRMLFEGDRPQDFIYLAVNRAFESLTGLKNVVGKKVSEVIPGIRETDPGLFEIYGRVVRSGVPERFETYVEALRMWFAISVFSPGKDHFVAVFDVITERKRAEEAVQRYVERLKALHEIDRAILAADSAAAIAQAALHHIRHLVPCLATSVVLFDFAAHEAVLLAAHPNSGGRVGPGSRLSLEEFGAVAVLREGRVDSVEDMQRLSRLLPLDQALQAEGTRSYIRVPLTAQGELIGALALGAEAAGGFTPEHVDIAREVADQLAIAIQQAGLHEQIRRHAMELEQRVSERTAELRTANQQLQEASRHKSQFLANMSHELRTPLNSIIGFADLLIGQGVGPLIEKQARYLTHIHNSGKHLLQLISDILDLSKVEAGKFVLQPEALTVGSTLEDILVIGRGLAHKKSQTVKAEIQAGLPPLRVDAVRFKQILFNLLSNAVKFTPESGLITVTARKVDQSTGQVVDSSRPVDQLTTRPIDTAGEWLEIAVTDTGIGIKAEEMPLLFQEFTQIERTHAQRQEGTGLGLALTRRLVELHGGRVWAESEGEGRGSTFTMVLPFAGPAT